MANISSIWIVTVWVVGLTGFTLDGSGKQVCLDGLHGNLLFHDGVSFKEPLATDVLADYQVEMVGPLGARFEPGMHLSETLLSEYKVLICYLPIEHFSSKELKAIKAFVDEGGGLLLVGENGEDLGLSAANQVASLFNAKFHNCVAAAPLAVKTFVLGEQGHRYVPDMRTPYFFDAKVGSHPIVSGIKSLPMRAGGAIEGGLPVAWAEGDLRITDLPAALWLDRCDSYSVYHPDKIAAPDEVRTKAIVMSALTSGRGRVVLWSDALLTRFVFNGYGGPELKKTITAVTRNIIAWLAGDKPQATSPYMTHPIGLPLDHQYVFFRYQLGRVPREDGRVEVTGPHGYSASCVIDPESAVHFSTGRAAPGEYKIGKRKIIVIAERRLHVLNGDETHPDDVVHASVNNTLKKDYEQARRILSRDRQRWGCNHWADYPCWDPLTACQVAAELGMEIGTIYRGWMLKPVGSFAGPERKHGFVFFNLPEFIWGIQTDGFYRGNKKQTNNGLRKLLEIYNTPGFLFWNAGGGNEPTMVYLDAESRHDVDYYRDTALKWGYTPEDLGAASWAEVKLHPLCDDYFDVLNENRNPYPDTVLRKAADARQTKIGTTREALLNWHLSNWAALKLLHDKLRCSLRFAEIFYPDMITCGGHEADWPYYYDNIALARGGHQWIEPGEMISVHGWCGPRSGLAYQAGAMVEIEQARYNCRRGTWIRYKNFTGDRREDIIATDELFENTYATALAHGACMFGTEKASEIGPRCGREESKEFLARVNRLRAVWLNLASEPSRIAVYRPGTHSLRAVQEDINWGWLATVRGLGGAQVNYLFRWNLRRGDLKRYKVLLLFGCHLLEQDIAERIAKWVKDGGTLIGDFDSGRWDESYQEQFWLKKVFGARPYDEPLPRRASRIEFNLKGLPPIMVGIHPDTPEADYCELKPIDEHTKGIGRFYHRGHHRGPAITLHPYGRGTAILVGLRMGREQWRRGSSPGLEDMLGTLVRSHHSPLAHTNKRDVEVGVWNGGRAKYLVAVRHVPPPPPTTDTDREVIALDGYGPIETEVRLQGAWEVFQLIGAETTELLCYPISSRIANGETTFTTTVPLRDFNVYAIFPNGRSPKNLLVRPEEPNIVAGSTISIHIKLDVAGDTPVELEVTYEGRHLYGDQLLLSNGSGLYMLDTAPNDPPGKWIVRVYDLIVGLQASTTLEVLPASSVSTADTHCRTTGSFPKTVTKRL